MDAVNKNVADKYRNIEIQVNWNELEIRIGNGFWVKIHFQYEIHADFQTWLWISP